MSIYKDRYIERLEDLSAKVKRFYGYDELSEEIQGDILSNISYVKQFLDDKVEDHNRTGRLPDGTYIGTWCAGQVQTTYDGSGYNFRTDKIVKGFVKCVIEVKDNTLVAGPTPLKNGK